MQENPSTPSGHDRAQSTRKTTRISSYTASAGRAAGRSPSRVKMALLVLLPLGILVVLGLVAYKLARGDKGTRRVVVDYNERLKQADELYEKAKGAYQQAMRLPAGDGRNQGLRGAIRVIGEARDLFHEIREKHPGERYRNLDERIADLQSLLKICRDNLTLSSSGSAPASPKDSDDKPQGIRYEDLPKGEPVYTK